MKCAKNVDAALPFFFTRNYHLYTESHLALLGAIFHDSKSNSGLVRKSSVSSFFNRSSSASISSGHIPERKKPVASDAVSFIGGLRRQLTKYEKSVVKNNKLAASAKHKGTSIESGEGAVFLES